MTAFPFSEIQQQQKSVFLYFYFFSPRKGNIGVIRKPCWKNWNPENAEELWWEKSAVSLEKCWFLIQCSRTSCCTCWIRTCTEETAPASCHVTWTCEDSVSKCALFSNDTHFDFAKAFVTKSGIFFSLFSVSSLLNLSCLQKVWDLVAVSVFIVDSAFGPPPSFLGVTSWCSLGLLFKLQTVGRITVTLKQSRLRESSSTETKCFLPIAQWNRVAALTEGTQWIYFHFKQNKNPCPRLAIRLLCVFELWPAPRCFRLLFANFPP